MRILKYLNENKNLRNSLILHLVVFIVFGFGIGFSLQKMTINSAPIIVDLSKVEISSKTNLPPKKENETKEKAKIKEKKYVPPKPKKTKPKPVVEKKSATKITESVKKKEIKKEKPKPETKPQPKQAEPDLSSLLASVEKLKPEEVKQNTNALKKEDIDAPQKDDGIKNGSVGNPELALSIGEKDAIASKLRACWNIDVGAKGVLDMLVGIRATLGQNGDVTDVEIIDSTRYNNNQVYRAIADSARRAVYVCDKKGNDSPFKILSKNYPEKYNMWKNIYLQFNPLDGGVF